MNRIARIACAILAFSVLPAASAKPVQRAHDWAKTFAVTSEGGFRMGNPDAKIRIVEYGSLTCPHCRHLSETAMGPIVSNYVRTGKASFEFRTMALNELDVAAILLARCNGPSHFFPIAEKLYATQPEWLNRIQTLADKELQRIGGLPSSQEFLELAKAARLLPLAAASGVPEAKGKACITSDVGAEKLQQMHDAAMAAGIQGTPTILVNDNVVAANDWETLEPYLRDAGG